MKRLLIMRPANSNWDYPDGTDFERPLNSFGLRVAPLMGSVIFENNLQPQLIVSSPAKRARQTAILVKEVAEVKTKITYSEQIYEASPFTLLNVISTTEDKYESLLLVGHNPGVGGLIFLLTGETPAMSTASMARLNLNIEKWNEIKSRGGYLEQLMRPVDLMQRVAA